MIKETLQNYIIAVAGNAGEVIFQEMDTQKFGHYTTNIALRRAKDEKRNPHDLAKEIREKLLGIYPDFFLKIEIALPGFLNIWIRPEIFYTELISVLSTGEMYGSSKEYTQNIQIEFISANPTGPLTLANGRGGFLGDVLGNVLSFSGATVEREYYVNDTGRQVLTLGKSLIASQGHFPQEETFYKGSYIQEWGDAHVDFILEHKENPEKVGEVAARDFLHMIQQVIQEKSGIRFNRFTSEKDIHTKGFPEKALRILQEKNFVYEADDALWFRTTTFGDDKDRVLITSEKKPTYLLADAGHYLETKERGFDRKINILGPDHYGYVARIQAAATALGLSKSEILITQAVRLMRDGTEVKMSKRKGEFVMFEDLIEEVGSDVSRFLFLMVSPQTHMDFDLAVAKEHSMKNPVFYVQYAAVRVRNIIKKVGRNVTLPKKFIHLTEPADEMLLRRIAEFPEVVSFVAQTLEAHHLIRYSTELARSVHNFYEHERVQGESEEILSERFALVKAVDVIFSNTFRLLGISFPEEM